MGDANSTITARIVENFDRFAGSYDAFSALQADVAATLVAQALDALPQGRAPQSILDIGCGTGHVATRAARAWPAAKIAAFDAAPHMLEIIRAKAPGVHVLQGDAADIRLDDRFDLVFSSMMAHWLDSPVGAVDRWRRLLNPAGRLFVAAPVQGSLAEWRRVCAQEGIADPTWSFPPEDFLDALASSRRIVAHPVGHPGLRAFLDSMKMTGAKTSNPQAPRIATAALRRALRRNDGGFVATFRVLYAEIAPL
jgi:malonyl-CoA O-methyltransferase